MSSNQKFTYGITLEIVGVFLFAIGLGISFTLIGACLGIPMAIVGLPLMIWGAVWLFQAKAEKTREIIAGGIQQGLAQREPYQTAAVLPPPVIAIPIRHPAAPPPIPTASGEEFKVSGPKENAVSPEAVDPDDEPEQLF